MAPRPAEVTETNRCGLAPWIVLQLLLAVFVITGWMGLDFGNHWDEGTTLHQLTKPIDTGIFLPGSYNYPSMVFDIGTMALAPETVSLLVPAAKKSDETRFQSYREMVSRRDALKVAIFAKSHDFLLRLRLICLLLTSLTGVWIFLAVLACNRSGWEAVFAAGLILTSWEIAYHARWVAPDALQMQFVALWLMCFAFATHSRSRATFWLRLSSVAAALAGGTKYQGGILLLPVLIQAIIYHRRQSPARTGWTTIVNEIAVNALIFGVTFLLTTPGAVLEPLVFFQSVRHIGHQYATGHYGYTVAAGGEHAYRLFCYLTCVLASPWPVLAILVSALACYGFVLMWKQSPLTTVLLLCAPLFFLLFVISYRVMIVRNYLLVVPFFAVLAARGAHRLWEKLSGAVWIQRVAVTGLILLLVGNLVFICYAAKTIRSNSKRRFGADVARHLKQHSSEKYFLSPAVATLLARENVTVNNVTTDRNAAQRIMFFDRDIDPSILISNRLGQYRLVSGPLDVNLDYYASWNGVRRVIELSTEDAQTARVLLDQ